MPLYYNDVKHVWIVQHFQTCVFIYWILDGTCLKPSMETQFSYYFLDKYLQYCFSVRHSVCHCVCGNMWAILNVINWYNLFPAQPSTAFWVRQDWSWMLSCVPACVTGSFSADPFHNHFLFQGSMEHNLEVLLYFHLFSLLAYFGDFF